MGELAGASAFTSLIIFVVEVFPSSRQAWSLDSLDSCRSPVFTVPTKDVGISKNVTSEPNPALVKLQLVAVYASREHNIQLDLPDPIEVDGRRRFVLTACLLLGLERTSRARPTRSESGRVEMWRGGFR